MHTMLPVRVIEPIVLQIRAMPLFRQNDSVIRHSYITYILLGCQDLSCIYCGCVITKLSNSSLCIFVLDLNLSEIPPDLESILIMSLDVPHKAGSRSSQEEFGWHKVGTAAGISRRELNYYQYSRQQSPTKLLLDKLGSQGRTISYLIDVLQKPRVELDSVANNIIRHRATRI